MSRPLEAWERQETMDRMYAFEDRMARIERCAEITPARLKDAPLQGPTEVPEWMLRRRELSDEAFRWCANALQRLYAYGNHDVQSSEIPDGVLVGDLWEANAPVYGVSLRSALLPYGTSTHFGHRLCSRYGLIQCARCKGKGEHAHYFDPDAQKIVMCECGPCRGTGSVSA